MATEIVFFDTIHELTERELKDALKGFYPTPAGLNEARWTKHHSDPQLTIGFFTWNSIQDHLNFTTLPQFKTLEAVVVPLARTMPPKIIHVHFKQGLPSFNPTSTLELITLKRQDEIVSWEVDVVHQSIEAFINVASRKGLRTTFYGVVHEDPKEFMILFDWESLQAREAVQTDETWMKFLESISPADKESHLLTPHPFREQRN